MLEKRPWKTVEPLIQEEQKGFLPGHGTVNQIFTLVGPLVESQEFDYPVYICFVDLEKTYALTKVPGAPDGYTVGAWCPNPVLDFHGQDLKAWPG